MRKRSSFAWTSDLASDADVKERLSAKITSLYKFQDSAGVKLMTTLRSRKLFFVLIVLLCANYSIAAQNSGEPDSKLTKVRRAIDAGNAVWVAAWAKGDAAMLPDTFTADGKELVAGGKIYKGRKQILALMRDTMQKRGGHAKLTVTTTDVWLDLNTAYETGTAVYEFTVGGQPQILERRYFTIWKRQPKRGSWKIYSNTGIAKQ
jgi:uncharacterized protein (TIGR02246 family)